jgi:hypothetical protein
MACHAHRFDEAGGANFGREVGKRLEKLDFEAQFGIRNGGR